MPLTKTSALARVYYNSSHQFNGMNQYYNNSEIFIKKYFASFKQKGGSKKLKIVYENHDYIYEYNKLDDIYVLFTSDAKRHICVVIIIEKESHSANINVLNGYEKTCLVGIGERVGTTLLMITLKMLEKYKDKFNINVITLSDHSTKTCNGKEIKMPMLSVLTTGDTWCVSELRSEPLIKIKCKAFNFIVW